MAKQRSGYTYEETAWYAVVTYTHAGKPQKIKRRAKSKPHAEQLAGEITHSLKEQFGSKINARGAALSESAGWYARVTYTDEGGRRKNVKQRAENKTAAKEAVKQIIRDLDDHGPELLDAAQMTFNDLAAFYEKNYLTEPEYVDGRKVAGLRSAVSLGRLLKVLKSYFGKTKLRLIGYGDLKRFKAERLKTPTMPGFRVTVVYTSSRKNRREVMRSAKSREEAEALISEITARLPTHRGASVVERRVEEKLGGQRSITTMNRELQLLRRMLNIAFSHGWIKRNPFTMGDALIAPGDERKRERILTREEEERLLAACTGKRSHIRPLLICALDTGMRKGEILKLVPADLDFDNRLITVRAFNTKTMRERLVAISERLMRELRSIVKDLPDGHDGPLFGITTDFKKAFIAARNVAGLPDVRFHDLRHTYATRLVSRHLPLSEVGRVLGHTQANTTFRYVNANVETARRATALIDEFYKPVDEGEKPLIN